MKKIKFITVAILAIGLIFGGTLNFSEAASETTAKTIEKLKKEVKKLTASNKAKDKEIAKLKKEVKAKNEEITRYKSTISQKNRFIKNKDEEINLWKNRSKDKDKTINDLRQIQFKYKSFVSHYIAEEVRDKIKYKSPCGEHPNDEYCNEDIRVRTYEFYVNNIYDYVSKKELKEITVNAYRASRIPGVNPKNIILEFPNEDVIIPLSSEL